MRVIVGKNAGFCYGVKRAVEGAEEALKNGNKIFCLGELVHNQRVINDLENKGITFIENVNIDSGDVIIRAHGISKEIYRYMLERKVNFLDYTCPNVLNIHKLAEEYANNGFFIILLGSSKHPENIGTISFCGENSVIIENEEEIECAIKKINTKKILIISQTTFSLKVFDDIVKKIKELLDSSYEIVIRNTICNATEIRQKETEQLSKNVECMIIIGGKNSSNTKKLYEIASKNCANAICIEDKTELNLEEIKKYNVIGIMAGASTPQASIDEVKELLEKI